MIGWIVHWKSSFRDYSGVVIEWSKDICIVYENILDEIYNFNEKTRDQLKFIRPCVKDFVEYKRKVLKGTNNLSNIHDMIIIELDKLDYHDQRIFKQKKEAIRHELQLKSLAIESYLSNHNYLNDNITMNNKFNDCISDSKVNDNDINNDSPVHENNDDEDHDEDDDSVDSDDNSDSDSDDESDSGSDDTTTTDDEKEKIDIKIKIFPQEDIRGFSIYLNKNGFKIMLLALKKDYNKNLNIYYIDIDGDRINIKTFNDFEYACRTFTENNKINDKKNKLMLFADVTMINKSISSTTKDEQFINQNKIIIPPINNTLTNKEIKSPIIQHNEYEFIWKKGQLLGKGSYGQVFSGINLSNGERIAVKEVKLQHTSKKYQQQIQALQQEIKILSSLEHRNIINYLGTESTKYTLRIFLELATDGTIKDAINEFGAFPEPLVRRFTCDIVEGLLFLHNKKFIHRDIKPTNLLVSGGIVKLGDFGCSTGIFKDDDPSQDIRHRTLAGTCIYMAPEVMYLGNNQDDILETINKSQTNSNNNNNNNKEIENNSNLIVNQIESATNYKQITSTSTTKAITSNTISIGYGSKADIWSMGCTLYEMATGKPPYPNAGAAIYAIAISKKYPYFPELFSEEAHSFLDRCFIEDPNDRASCEELMRLPFLITQSIEEVRAQTAAAAISNRYATNHRTSTITLELPENFEFFKTPRDIKNDDDNYNSKLNTINNKNNNDKYEDDDIYNHHSSSLNMYLDNCCEDKYNNNNNNQTIFTSHNELYYNNNKNQSEYKKDNNITTNNTVMQLNRKNIIPAINNFNSDYNNSCKEVDEDEDCKTARSTLRSN